MKNKDEELSFSRMSIAHYTYLEMALDNYILYQQNKEKLKSLLNVESDFNCISNYEKVQLENELNKNFVSIIVFSALFMESFIYDYGAIYTSDSYMLKYVDKLDLLSKWIIVPRLVTGYEIDKTRNSFSILKNLVKTRNTIVHWKSTNITDESIKKATEKKFYNEIDPNSIFKSIIDILSQIESFDHRNSQIRFSKDLIIKTLSPQ